MSCIHGRNHTYEGWTIKKYKYCPFCGDKIIRGEDHQ